MENFSHRCLIWPDSQGQIQVGLCSSPTGLKKRIALNSIFVLQMLVTNFELSVLWNGDHTVYISIPDALMGKVCGLCGTYDGDPSNDFYIPDGSVVSYH